MQNKAQLPKLGKIRGCLAFCQTAHFTIEAVYFAPCRKSVVFQVGFLYSALVGCMMAHSSAIELEDAEFAARC